MNNNDDDNAGRPVMVRMILLCGHVSVFSAGAKERRGLRERAAGTSHSSSRRWATPRRRPVAMRW